MARPVFSRLFRYFAALTIAAALVFSVAAEAAAQSSETKTFPPYPNLWQRAIPMAEWVVDESSLDVEAAPDGDVLIRFGGGGRTGWIKFFSGESYVTTDPTKQAEKRAHYSKWDRSGRIKFPNGDSLNYMTAALDEEDCYGGFFPYFSYHRRVPPEQANDIDAKIPWIKHWLVYLDKPRSPPFNDECGWQKQKENFEEWVFALPFKMILLKDGTLIAASPDLGEAFRLNPDMSSPAIDNHRLFLVDEDTLYAALKPIRRLTANLKPEHDAARAYLDALRDQTERKKNFWR